MYVIKALLLLSCGMPSGLMEIKREGCVIWRANLLRAADLFSELFFNMCGEWEMRVGCKFFSKGQLRIAIFPQSLQNVPCQCGVVQVLLRRPWQPESTATCVWNWMCPLAVRHAVTVFLKVGSTCPCLPSIENANQPPASAARALALLWCCACAIWIS